MNRIFYLIAFASLMTFNTSLVFAETSIERPVIKIASTSKNNLLFSIPGAALTIRNGIPGVFVVENNEARFRMVRPGKVNKGKVEILSGLFGNEVLLIGGLEEMHDGSPVTTSTKKLTVKK